jgi:Serine dehydrogenase proteinase
MARAKAERPKVTPPTDSEAVERQLDEAETDGAGREPEPLHQVLYRGDETEIKGRWSEEVQRIAAKYRAALKSYCLLCLYDPQRGLSGWDADQIYRAVQNENADKARDILLIIVSTGGSIEPAYQISKLCRAFAKSRFVAVVPRQAKSAATLIALGADEIHIGLLGELGPIDPQLSGLPALGVLQALNTIASLSQQYPGSASMFAQYLQRVLTVEQIGYCERIGESAVQYADRLLSTKSDLPEDAHAIAQKLVYEYKHHGFVIDQEEAQAMLGAGWVKTSSKELEFAEEVYQQLEIVNLLLGIFRKKRMHVAGGLETGSWIFDQTS